MTGFIIIGAVGLGLVLVTLILGDIFEGVFDAFDFEAGAGVLSAPVIGAFLASFGFGAALIMAATDVGAAGGALGGLASGLVIGGIALVMTRTLMGMESDDTPRSADLVGQRAVVITRIPADGLGEVTLTYAGQIKKLSARAPAPVPAGTAVVVTAVTSSSSVVVAPEET